MSDALQHQQAEGNLAAAEPLPDDDRLNGLPLELQLHIANAVGERCDRAALALASPRPLGLAACRQLPSYQGLEMSLAFHHVLGGAIDEQPLRWYASRSEATPEGCKWLAGVAAAAGLTKCKIIVWPPLLTDMRHGLVRRDGEQRWFLMKPDSTCGALLQLRRGEPQVRTVHHYEGVEGAERLVRVELPRGEVQHYEGEKGAERLVRCDMPGSRRVHYFEGEQGVERLVRCELHCELHCGIVQHYEGEQGAERMARVVLPTSEVQHFKGEQGTERLVRLELPGGAVIHYEGEEGARRVVRIELPFGGVLHFDGETGSTE